jgi:citrate synthase
MTELTPDRTLDLAPAAPTSATTPSAGDRPAAKPPADSLTITDNRTGKHYEVPISEGTIRATDLRQIKASADDFGLMTYDPAFQNTAACRSRITYIDGDKGVLLYRGYPIEQLAEQSTFLETAFLILFGELPTAVELEAWTRDITLHTMLHENIKKLMEGFQYDAHPMGVFLSTVGALATTYPEAKRIQDEDNRRLQIVRLIAKVPSIAAYAYRHSIGRPYIYPDNSLSFTGNFLNMLFRMSEVQYRPHPILERALDVLFILHADHEQNCSTSVMRGIGSAHADPYSSLAGAAAALYGPLHGGANEAVLHMLKEIGSVKNIPDFITRVKKGEGRLMGFGHRVYKSYDPRARIIKQTADQVFAVTGRNPLLDIALELERIALEDDYFVSRKLYPNVDFYSGLIYQAMGFPLDMFPVLFAIPRTAGWLAQWDEMLRDSEQKIARPRQLYVGAMDRDYVPIGQRS